MRPTWVTRAVVGIVVATFFSDVGHEMATAVLPLFLGSLGLGAAALGAMEGAADLVSSLSKLGGGLVGHRVERKRALASAGYFITAVGTTGLALVHGLVGLVSLRAAAWVGRGFRSPLRDFMLADEVEPSHFGRAYGFERAADMLGAVVGPLAAALMLWFGVPVRTVILVSFGPALLAALSFFTLTRDRPAPPPASGAARPGLPRGYWGLGAGVFLFGLGDFSRTFLILLLARALGEGHAAAGTLSLAVLIYTGHNALSAVVALVAGRAADRIAKRAVLVVGYLVGAATHLTLVFGSGQVAPLVVAVALSAIYVAIEETVEKASVAAILPREVRSLGLGILACGNAVGDMASSVFVGLMLAHRHDQLAFAIPAGFALAGALWLALYSAGSAGASAPRLSS